MKFWAEAVATAVYMKNLLPSQTLDWKNPQQLWITNEPNCNIGHLRIFGCLAYVFNPKAVRGKWEKTSRPCMFIGYTRTSKIMKFFDTTKNRVITSAHAKIHEHEYGWEGSFSKPEFADFFTDLTNIDITTEETDLLTMNRVMMNRLSKTVIRQALILSMMKQMMGTFFKRQQKAGIVAILKTLLKQWGIPIYLDDLTGRANNQNVSLMSTVLQTMKTRMWHQCMWR